MPRVIRVVRSVLKQRCVKHITCEFELKLVGSQKLYLSMGYLFSVAETVSCTAALQLYPLFDVRYIAPSSVTISALFSPVAFIYTCKYNINDFFGMNGIQKKITELTKVKSPFIVLSP